MISISTSCAIPRPGWSRTIRAGCSISRSAVEPATAIPAYPVTVRLERLDPAHAGQVETVRARFVVGCDGARSAVRKSPRAGAARGLGQPGLGRHGRAGRHRFPRHPPEVGDPVGQRRQRPDHSPRGRLSRPHLYRTRQAQRGRAGLEPQHHDRSSRSRRRSGSCIPMLWT